MFGPWDAYTRIN